MKFDYHKTFSNYSQVWLIFDNFLEELSEDYEEEFKNEIYINKRFMAIGIVNNDIQYSIDKTVPKVIKDRIINKLRELFP